MKRTLLLLVVITNLLAASSACLAESRPRYGGSVRILLRHKVTSLDPLSESDDPATRDRVAGLMFETLTQIDAEGHTRAKLASAWQADAGNRDWIFTLRQASFHDHSEINSASVAASLRSVSPDWKITVNSQQTFTIETPSPAPHLPELLALPRYAIIKRLPGDVLLGTGPYTLAEWQPGEHVLLAANDDYWNGRPFPDSIDFRTGLSLREHLLERNLTLDHAAEPSPDQLRSLEQANQTLLLSRPADMLLVFFPEPGAKPRKAVDPRLREALSSAINRATINNVLLQRKGVPAGGLLPQWLTGWEFLFPASQDMERGRRLRADANSTQPLSLIYDSSDPVMKMVAERIAVDAREAGILVQTFGDPHSNSRSGRATLNADAILLRVALSSLDATAALTELADELALPADTVSAIVKASRPEELVEIERSALADYRLVPVVRLPQALWLNSNVHEWQQLPNGEWRLDQLWVEGSR
ncbi:MAG TPA: ABC transporter substrate-binding protein [Candidatus Angelobacter sp.]|nr:ABC transporter substrate-binding protein [Candidatus Angelobacter sp.]